jgi:hypothetical protein
VNLVEAWQMSDMRLASTFGRSDGQYEKALMEATVQEPPSLKDVSLNYRNFLRDVIKRGSNEKTFMTKL